MQRNENLWKLVLSIIEILLYLMEADEKDVRVTEFEIL